MWLTRRTCPFNGKKHSSDYSSERDRASLSILDTVLFRANPNINFIWKFDQEIDVPSNVLRKNWLPQNDLLGGSNAMTSYRLN